MRALAGFVVRGPGQAALVAATALTLSVVFPPIVWLANAAVALYVMRYGWQRSTPMLLASVLGAAGLFWAVLAHPLLGAISAAVFWLPVVIAALVLRATVSLELATLACVGVALAAVLLLYALLPDPVGYWREFLGGNPPLAEMLAQMGQEAEADLLQAFAELGTGLMATGVLLNTLVGLYLGRYWQALQFQPGGFREAFIALRLGRSVIAAALLVAVVGLFSGTALGLALALPLVFLLTVQGLAVVHGLAAARSWPKVVLVMVYMALLVPHAMALICVLAIVDAWFDIRARAQLTQ